MKDFPAPERPGARLERSLARLIEERDRLRPEGDPTLVDALDFAIGKFGNFSKANPLTCSFCGGANLDHYMVHNSVWYEAMGGPKGYLHFGCLERKLGRSLRSDDFPSLPINDGIRFGILIGLNQGPSRDSGTDRFLLRRSKELGRAVQALRNDVFQLFRTRKNERYYRSTDVLKAKIAALRQLRGVLGIPTPKPEIPTPKTIWTNR